MTEERVRTLVREIIESVLDDLEKGIATEISTTSGAGAYETPKAFKKNKMTPGEIWDDDDDEDDADGYDTFSSDDDEEDGVIKKKLKMDEARTRYHKLKNDQSRTAKQKIGQSIRNAKKAVREAKKTIKVISKYKNEFGVSHDNYWKTTQKDIYKMESDLLDISQKLKELRS